MYDPEKRNSPLKKKILHYKETHYWVTYMVVLDVYYTLNFSRWVIDLESE